MVDQLLKRELRRFESVEQAAERLGVTTAYIYMLLKGERRPSPKLLITLGLKRIERLVRA